MILKTSFPSIVGGSIRSSIRISIRSSRRRRIVHRHHRSVVAGVVSDSIISVSSSASSSVSVSVSVVALPAVLLSATTCCSFHIFGKACQFIASVFEDFFFDCLFIVFCFYCNSYRYALSYFFYIFSGLNCNSIVLHFFNT